MATKLILLLLASLAVVKGDVLWDFLAYKMEAFPRWLVDNGLEPLPINFPTNSTSLILDSAVTKMTVNISDVCASGLSSPSRIEDFGVSLDRGDIKIGFYYSNVRWSFHGTHASAGRILDTVDISGEGPFLANVTDSSIGFHTYFHIVDGFIRLNESGSRDEFNIYSQGGGKLENLFDEATSGYEPHVTPLFVDTFLGYEGVNNPGVTALLPHLWRYLADIFEVTPVTDIMLPSSPWPSTTSSPWPSTTDMWEPSSTTTTSTTTTPIWDTTFNTTFWETTTWWSTTSGPCVLKEEGNGYHSCNHRRQGLILYFFVPDFSALSEGLNNFLRRAFYYDFPRWIQDERHDPTPPLPGVNNLTLSGVLVNFTGSFWDPVAVGLSNPVSYVYAYSNLQEGNFQMSIEWYRNIWLTGAYSAVGSVMGTYPLNASGSYIFTFPDWLETSTYVYGFTLRDGYIDISPGTVSGSANTGYLSMAGLLPPEIPDGLGREVLEVLQGNLHAMLITEGKNQVFFQIQRYLLKIFQETPLVDIIETPCKGWVEQLEHKLKSSGQKVYF